MQAHWIRIDTQQFSIAEIMTGIYPDSLSDFQKTSLTFCIEWLNGKETFTLQTSGSTGTPKKISVTRQQLKASAQLTVSALALKKNDISLVCLDTRYIAGVMMIVRSLEAGMNMILVDPSSNPLEKLEENTSIDFTAFVPLQLETILRSPDSKKLNQIKIALIGGAALNSKTVKDIKGMKCNFYATYGMTETLSHIALQKLNGNDAQDYFEVLQGITLSKDKRDCLIIHAPHLSNEPILTNDLVEFITSPQFRWLGRADNIINTGGVKVIPEKIEASISILFEELNVLNRFFVAALPDNLLGQSVNLFIEGNPFGEKTGELIHEKINQSLNRFERPKSIYYVLHFINTDTGKIDKNKTMTLIQR
jgi:o-succinylbenzoate---CoA ligase